MKEESVFKIYILLVSFVHALFLERFCDFGRES